MEVQPLVGRRGLMPRRSHQPCTRVIVMVKLRALWEPAEIERQAHPSKLAILKEGQCDARSGEKDCTHESRPGVVRIRFRVADGILDEQRTKRAAMRECQAKARPRRRPTESDP